MRSRLDGCEEGLALLFAEILDHHLIVVRQRTRPAEQLLDRELQVLGFALARRMCRHGSLKSRSIAESERPVAVQLGSPASAGAYVHALTVTT